MAFEKLIPQIMQQPQLMLQAAIAAQQAANQRKQFAIQNSSNIGDALLKGWQMHQTGQQQGVENLRAEQMMGMKRDEFGFEKEKFGTEMDFKERKLTEIDIPTAQAEISAANKAGLVSDATVAKMNALLEFETSTAGAEAAVAEAKAGVAPEAEKARLAREQAALKSQLIKNGIDEETADAVIAGMQLGPAQAQAEIDQTKARTEEIKESGQRAWDTVAQGWHAIGFKADEIQLKKEEFIKDSQLIDAKISSMEGIEGAKAQAFVDDLYKQIETTAAKLSGTVDPWGQAMEIDEKGKVVLRARLKNLQAVLKGVSGEGVTTAEQMKAKYLQIVGEAFRGVQAEDPEGPGGDLLTDPDSKTSRFRKKVVEKTGG